MIEIVKAILSLLKFLLEGRQLSKAEQTARINFLETQMEKRREAIKKAVLTGSTSDINRALSGLSDEDPGGQA